MKNKVSIWLTPDFDSPINYYTNNFCTHLTLKNNLTYSKALNLFSKLNNFQLEIEFSYLARDVIHDVHRLYYKIKDPVNKPEWWPKNAHITFLYKYKQQITNTEKNYLQDSVNIKKIFLNHLHIVNCSGPPSTWKILLSK